MSKRLFFLFFCCVDAMLFAQKPIITILDSSKKISIRGLNVVNDKIVWCSGSNGSVARSINGGKTFIWQTINGYEKQDFRDIEAFDSNTAIIMAISEPAIILKTKDGGKIWKKVFEDSTKGTFLDAMDFDEKGNGIAIGDPIDRKSYVLLTKNEGDDWFRDKRNDSLASGEAFFASSGTDIKIIKNKIGLLKTYVFVTGCTKSALYVGNIHKYLKLPIIQGRESTGANSIDVFKDKAVIVGGDFANDKDITTNCVLVELKKDLPKFSHPQTPPHGYRSCVVYLNEKTLVACGTSGIDVSYDSGNNWQLISNESFNVVQKAKKGNVIFLAGGRGRIARLQL